MPNSLARALSETKISDVLTARRPLADNLVFVYKNDTLEHALNLLAENNFLSLPVFSSSPERCEGLVDMNHIMSYICGQLQKSNNDIGSIDLSVPVSKVVDNSRWDPLLSATPDTLVLDLLKWFAGGYSHRAVVGSHDPTICSQSDVITYLSNKWCGEDAVVTPEISSMLTQPAFEVVKGQECHLRHDRKEGGVTFVKPEDSVMDAMLMLHRDAVSAAAVVDSQGKLIGNFSSSDLRGLVASDLGILNEDVREFLLKKSARFYPIAIDKKTNLAEAIRTMAESRIHRVWVVEDLTHPFPVDVITMSDVMKFICNHNE